MLSSMSRSLRYLLSGVLVLWFAVLCAPQLLAWPDSIRIGQTRIYAEEPIAPKIRSILARSDALLKSSTIYSDGDGRRIFLTNGGWRWRLLSFPGGGAFAYSKPLTEAIIVNRNSIAKDLAWNGQTFGGQRTLSGVIAHERTHGLIRSHFGLLAATRFPTWKVEGYCDHVAGESSLTQADYTKLMRTGTRHPAIVFFEGRRKVARILLSNGQSADALFRP